jgi:hypothetical protein
MDMIPTAIYESWRCFALSHAEGRLCEQEELED